jgi:hypothetical protein
MALSGQLRCMKYLAKVHQFHVHVHGHVHVLSISVSVSTSVSVSMSISVLFQFKYGAMDIYGQRHGNYIVDSQGSYEVAWKLKGLSYERGWFKSADNLCASPFKRSIE